MTKQYNLVSEGVFNRAMKSPLARKAAGTVGGAAAGTIIGGTFGGLSGLKQSKEKFTNALGVKLNKAIAQGNEAAVHFYQNQIATIRSMSDMQFRIWSMKRKATAGAIGVGSVGAAIGAIKA